MVRAIYSNRHFQVVEGLSSSEWKSQQAGISQGCPFSPFLFSIVTTVVLWVAERETSCSPHSVRPHINISDILMRFLHAVVEIVPQTKYLAGLVCQDGRLGAELSRRTREATGCFNGLARILKPAQISRTRKRCIYEACVLPKLFMHWKQHGC